MKPTNGGDQSRGEALPEIQCIPPKNADQGACEVQVKIEMIDRSFDGLTFRQYLNAARFTHYQHNASQWLPVLRAQLAAYGVGVE
ncbi:hypothetical protein [Aeromonas caviae]|uniref:hypothetical protein n=1 Tax=Aeromonas caviae TaxID=648 RepID=UPI002B4870DF|nr:hypothetical protein [Aeromonas caviae]